MEPLPPPAHTPPPGSCNSTDATPGQVLRRFRLRAGMTQADVGERIGVSGNSVHNWEVGRSTPMPKSARAVADLFDIPIGAIRPDLAPRRQPGDPPALPAGVGHSWQAIPDDAWSEICTQARLRGGTPTELLRAFARGLRGGP